MAAHHEDTLAAFASVTECDRDNLGLVLIGSVARGEARDDSDVDVYLIVTEDSFALATEERRVSFVTRDEATYEGGYIDVKVASPEYLRHAIARADEPTRASFAGARVVWSRLDELESLVRQLPTLSDAEFDARALSFLAQARVQRHYFLPQAADRGNVLLLHHAAVHLAYACGRLLLAHNRRLFPGPKYLEKLVAQLPDKPDGIVALLRSAVSEPGPPTAGALLDAIEGLSDWPQDWPEAISKFVEDNELAWFTGGAPPEYR